MRATCPTCETGYTIPDDRIGPKGRKVRCTRCGKEWRVMLADAATDAQGDPAPPPATPATPAAARSDANLISDLFGGADETAASEWDEPTPQTGAAPADPARAETAPPVETAIAAPAADAGPPPPPAEAAPAKVRIKVKTRGLRIRLPRLPPAVTRLAPFVGPLIFVSAILVCVALITFRTAVVAAAPTLAGFYATLGLEVNLRGLTFGPIQTLREMENGQPVLVVEGTLSNATAESREIPGLRFALRDGEAQELYAWSVDPRATTIAPGDQMRFRTRLVAPPERAADLQVRFVERRNRQAGLP